MRRTSNNLTSWSTTCREAGVADVLPPLSCRHTSHQSRRRPGRSANRRSAGLVSPSRRAGRSLRWIGPAGLLPRHASLDVRPAGRPKTAEAGRRRIYIIGGKAEGPTPPMFTFMAGGETTW